MDDRLCVIGAGAAGLGAMEVLQRRDIPFDCFEQTDRVGGHWHTDYESLHLITSRDLSGFAGHPMPADYPVYPSRDQMRDYLEGFAERPACAHACASGCAWSGSCRSGWQGATAGAVETSDGATRDYAGVVVCNGHLWDPNLPSYPGSSPARRSTPAPTARSTTWRARGC